MPRSRRTGRAVAAVEDGGCELREMRATVKESAETVGDLARRLG